MKVTIHSREIIVRLILQGSFPENTVVISFYDPAIRRIDKNYTHIDYRGVCDTVFYSELRLTHISQKHAILPSLFTARTKTAWILSANANTDRAEAQAVRRRYLSISIPMG